MDATIDYLEHFQPPNVATPPPQHTHVPYTASHMYVTDLTDGNDVKYGKPKCTIRFHLELRLKVKFRRRCEKLRKAYETC